MAVSHTGEAILPVSISHLPCQSLRPITYLHTSPSHLARSGPTLSLYNVYKCLQMPKSKQCFCLCRAGALVCASHGWVHLNFCRAVGRRGGHGKWTLSWMTPIHPKPTNGGDHLDPGNKMVPIQPEGSDHLSTNPTWISSTQQGLD